MADQNNPQAAPQARRNESDTPRTIRAPEPRNGGAPLSESQAGDAIAGLLDPRKRAPGKAGANPAPRADANADLEEAARASLSAPDTDDERDEDGPSEEEDDETTPQRDDDAPADADDVDDELTDDERAEAEEREADEREFNARKVKVKIDGQEAEVTVSELLKGYQRRADYSRKTDELAREKTAVASHTATVLQQRQALDQILEHQQNLLVQAYGVQEPDWDALYQENPLEFVRQQAAWGKRNQELGKLAAMRQANAEHALAVHQHQFREHIAAEGRKMLERNPDWADPVKGKAIRSKLETYAEKIGYPKGSLETVTDARHLEVLHKAMQLDELFDRVKSGKARAKPIERAEREPAAPSQPKPRTAVPGAAAPPPTRRDRATEKLAQAKKQAARSGKAEDAGAAIAMLLPR